MNELPSSRASALHLLCRSTGTKLIVSWRQKGTKNSYRNSLGKIQFPQFSERSSFSRVTVPLQLTIYRRQLAEPSSFPPAPRGPYCKLNVTYCNDPRTGQCLFASVDAMFAAAAIEMRAAIIHGRMTSQTVATHH